MCALVARLCPSNRGHLTGEKLRVVGRCSSAGLTLRCVRFYRISVLFAHFVYRRWMRVLDVKCRVTLMQRERVLGQAVSASTAAVKAVAAVEETKVLEEKALAAAEAARREHAAAVELAAAAMTIAEEKAAEFKCAVGFDRDDDDDDDE